MQVQADPQFGDVTISKRYLIQNRAEAIRNLEQGLVELITNANDAYATAAAHGLVRNFKVVIAIDGVTRTVSVTDTALGMTLSDVQNRLAVMGMKTNSESIGVQGIFSRGAKDVTEIGVVKFHALRAGILTKLQINRDFSYEISSAPATESDLIPFSGQLQGLHVTVAVIESYWMNDIIALIERIENYFSTRYMYADPNKVFYMHATGSEGEILIDRALTYKFPEGVFTRHYFEVPGYSGVQAILDVIVCDNPIEVISDERQQRFGFLLCGDDGIYGVEFFRHTFRSDPFFRRIHGRLYCKHIRQLMLQWDYNLSKGITDPNNSKPILNPARFHGIHVDHPFTTKLFLFPVSKVLDVLVTLSNTQTSISFSNFGNEIKNFQMFSSEYLTKSDKLLEFRKKELGNVIKGLEDANGTICWTGRSAPSLDLVTFQTQAGSDAVSSNELFRIFTRMDQTHIDAVQNAITVDANGELVSVPIDQKTLDSSEYVFADVNKFDLQLRFDVNTDTQSPVRYVHNRFLVIVFIHLNHKLVAPLIEEREGVIFGMQNPAAQMLIAMLVGRVMGKLVSADKYEKIASQGDSVLLAQTQVQELEQIAADDFASHVFQQYALSTDNFNDYITNTY